MIFRTTKCDCSLLCWSRTHRNIHSTLQADGKDWQWAYQWNHRHLQWSHATQAGSVFHGITYYQLFFHYFFILCCVFRQVNRCFACCSLVAGGNHFSTFLHIFPSQTGKQEIRFELNLRWISKKCRLGNLFRPALEILLTCTYIDSVRLKTPIKNLK